MQSLERPIKDEIYKNSSQWAQQGLKNYIDSNHDQFFVQGGVAFELLGKAFLATIHPCLIVDKDFDSLLQVCGAAQHSRKPPGNIRTITARDVIYRITQVLPQLKSYEPKLTLLSELRNGAVHLVKPGLGTEIEVITPYLRSSNILLEALDKSQTDYFGAYTEVTRKLVDESTHEVERTIVLKMARAAENYLAKFGEMEVGTVEQISEVVRQAYEYDSFRNVPETCPVCDASAVSSGESEVKWEADDWDGSMASPIVTVYVNYFICRMCGLTLNGQEEIRAARLRAKIEVDDPDLNDLLEGPFDHQ